MRLGRWFATAFLLASVGACSLVVDASDIDEGCKTGEKPCDGKCVLISDPAYGCTLSDCVSCAFARAIPHCVDNECAVKTCLAGFCGADCSTSILIDEDNCGACGMVCNADTGTCRNGECMPK